VTHCPDGWSPMRLLVALLAPSLPLDGLRGRPGEGRGDRWHLIERRMVPPSRVSEIRATAHSPLGPRPSSERSGSTTSTWSSSRTSSDSSSSRTRETSASPTSSSRCSLGPARSTREEAADVHCGSGFWGASVRVWHRHGDGTHGRSDRCRRSFVLPILPSGALANDGARKGERSWMAKPSRR
jgi:hypothetical protein